MWASALAEETVTTASRQVPLAFACWRHSLRRSRPTDAISLPSMASHGVYKFKDTSVGKLEWEFYVSNTHIFFYQVYVKSQLGKLRTHHQIYTNVYTVTFVFRKEENGIVFGQFHAKQICFWTIPCETNTYYDVVRESMYR